MLTQNKDRSVGGSATDVLDQAFSQVQDKAQAWQDLIRMIHGEDSGARWRAACALGQAFSQAPDKAQAWQDLHMLTQDEDSSVRGSATDVLGQAFSQVPDKAQAWQDLIRLIQDEDGSVRWRAAYALAQALSQAQDKAQAWQDMHRLTLVEDSSVRGRAAYALGQAFSQVPDKAQAWQDLIRLTQDEDSNVRWRASDVLDQAFLQVQDKAQAWKDLIRLTQDEDSSVRGSAAYALSQAFSQVPDKAQAWHDLHMLTQDEDRNVRWSATDALGQSFSQVPYKAQAWQDMHRLTQDADSSVRGRAAYAIGQAFSQIPDKAQAWKDLQRLTKDDAGHVQMYAYHSMGRASVLKATEAQNNIILKRKLEEALGYFKRSAQEANNSPARFCYPFYRTYFGIVFKDAEDDEVQRYLKDAKEAIGSSKSKDELFKAVENLANALKESKRLKDKSVQEVANELNCYRWYCEKAAEHMKSAEDNASGAVKLMRVVNPLLEKRIQDTVAEIQERAKQICLITHKGGTELEKLGADIKRAAESLSSEDLFSMQENVSIISSQLEELCKMLPDNTKNLACKTVEAMRSTKEIPDKLDKMKLALAYIYPVVEVALQTRDLNQDIRTEIDKATKAIIDSDYKIKMILLERLDDNQKIIVEATLKALDERHQDQRFQNLLEETITALAEMMNEINKKGALDSDPVLKEEVEDASKVISDYKVSSKRKLEITIPLIPTLLGYKWEIEFEGGGINLKAAWNNLIKSFRS